MKLFPITLLYNWIEKDGCAIQKYRSENEFRKAVADYIEKYNTRRPHTTLQYKTPQQVEAEFQGKSKEIVKPETRQRGFESKTFRRFYLGIDRFFDF